MRNKKALNSSFVVLILGVIIIVSLLAFFAFTRTGINGLGEDSWIKNEKGIYVEHGKPAEVPSVVSEQKNLMFQAIQLYQQKKSEGMQFSSQCLGMISSSSGDNYSVDIVHSPRTEEDDKSENQCEDYRNGIAKHFIELDSSGEIVRIN